MNFEYAKLPQWANSDRTLINLIVKWDSFNEEMPFTASTSDPESYGRAIFESAKNGQFGDVAAFQPYIPTPEELLAEIEAKRKIAYTSESDPLFFKFQRGEVDKQVWLDKVAEIKARYPKV